MNTKQLTDSLEAPLRGLVKELIDGTVADLDGPIRETAAALALAAAENRPDLVVAARDQLALIVLQKKMVVKDSFKGIFDRVLLTGMDVLVGGAIAFLASAKV